MECHTVSSPGLPTQIGPYVQGREEPLPWVSTGCRSERMVRRGSTVRVRQRALFTSKTARKRAVFVAGLDTVEHLPCKEGADDSVDPLAAAKLAWIREIGKLRHRVRRMGGSWGQVLGTLQT
jgi:hypothetical protein